MRVIIAVRDFFVRLWIALVNAGKDMNNNHSLTLAAGLSYYFMLSLFPALIFAAAVLAYLPIPHLFDKILDMLARFAPQDSMAMLRRILTKILKPHTALLSVGLLGTLWSASGGFTAIMDGLNVSYSVPEKRPIWWTRLLGIGLTFLIGSLMIVALGVMMVGPRFGEWMAAHLNVSPLWTVLWPPLHWAVAVAFAVLAVELLYYLCPNVKQRFWSTLPGAVVSVLTWIGASYLLGIYFRHFANYNKTYGSLGAVIALMLWFYVSGVALLFGGEINAEFLKACGAPQLEIRYCPDGKKLPLKEKHSPEEKEKLERKGRVA